MTIRNTAAPGVDDPPPDDDLLFGRYRRVRELGRGGMGVVLLARDETLGIPVALKMVPDLVLDDSSGIVELKKEVLRGMALTHPGIVRVYSFEQDRSGGAIVMEYVEGETLAQAREREPGGCFEPAQIHPWISELCGLLDYAHGIAKIAHRDLKPRNILLTRDGAIKVADFGISSSLSDTMSRVSVRLDGAGTPPYMSPQQMRGEHPSGLDDIYSLGATIYELLTGKPPFFRGDIVAQVLQERPPTVTARRSELGLAGRPSIPLAWERTVAACLAKDAADRPASGHAVLEGLAQTAPPVPVRVTVLPLPELSEATETPLPPDPSRRRPAETSRSQPPPPMTLPVPTYAHSRPGAPRSWRGLKTVATLVVLSALTAALIQGARHRQRPRANTAPASAVGPHAPATSGQSRLGGATLEADTHLDMDRPQQGVRRHGQATPAPR